jgi:hypothetical protein
MLILFCCFVWSSAAAVYRLKFQQIKALAHSRFPALIDSNGSRYEPHQVWVFDTAGVPVVGQRATSLDVECVG